MAQVISPISAPSVVEGFVRSYIFTDTDGSQRVDQEGLITFLAEQFSYFNGAGSYDTPTSKRSTAESIAVQLGAVVNRENWYGNAFYPAQSDNHASDAQSRMIDIKNKLMTEAHTLEQPYIDFAASIPARAKSIFTSIVAPSFPAGTDPIDTTRTYVETFVTDWGEESRPSDPSALVTLDQNDTASITCSAAPGGRNITARRLYRSATGTQSSAFKLQGEYPVSTTVITDSKEEKLLSDVCPTFGWLEPPATLKGLTGMPNGMQVGYDGYTLYACEPYAPYAYPARYDKPLKYLITGLVAVGGAVFVGTNGRPYLVSGTDSASLSEENIASEIPCVSSRSMVAIKNSVIYASSNGLALYENGSADIITEQIFDARTWQSYNPSSMRAAEFNGNYLAFYTKADSSKGALVFDYKNRTFADLDQPADAVFSKAGKLYILSGSEIYDFSPSSGANRIGYWYSKRIKLARPQSLRWLQVDYSFLNGGAVSATVRVYGDGVIIHTATLTNKTPVPLPAGRYADWYVEIESDAIIDGVILASTTEELKAAI